MKLTTRDMIIIALFAAITSIGAKINFLIPYIPFTMQPVIVMTAGCLIGSKNAFFSQLLYITMGLLGMPVFSKPIAGPAYIAQPSFGYLIGFALAAYIIGFIIERFKKKTLFAFISANLAGLILIYFMGTIYMYGLMNIFLGKNISIYKSIMLGVAPFILKDFIMGFVVSTIAYKIYKRVNLSLYNK